MSVAQYYYGEEKIWKFDFSDRFSLQRENWLEDDYFKKLVSFMENAVNLKSIV